MYAKVFFVMMLLLQSLPSTYGAESSAANTVPGASPNPSSLTASDEELVKSARKSFDKSRNLKAPSRDLQKRMQSESDSLAPTQP